MNGLMVSITRWLGFSPKPPKKGAREAATFVMLFAIGVTTAIVCAAIWYNNPEFLLHGSPLVMGIVIPAVSLFAHAMHLKSVEIQTFAGKNDEPSLPFDAELGSMG